MEGRTAEQNPFGVLGGFFWTGVEEIQMLLRKCTEKFSADTGSLTQVVKNCKTEINLLAFEMLKI